MHEAVPDGRFTDVGFGISAITTWEWAQAFPAREVVGLEVDDARVMAARRDFPQLRFISGSFEALTAEPRSAVLRVANVARGMQLDEAKTLPGELERSLVDGGLLLEGSTDVTGALSSFFVWRRSGGSLRRELLVFHSTFERGFAPMQFRDVLPRELRRDVKPGRPITQLLAAWDEIWRSVKTTDPRESFVLSTEQLRTRGLARAAVPEGFVAVPFPDH